MGLVENEVAIVQTTGFRVLTAIRELFPFVGGDADLLFIAERLAAALDERRNCGLPGEFKANVLLPITVLQFAQTADESTKALREAAEFSRCTWLGSCKVKQEFAARATASRAEASRQRETSPAAHRSRQKGKAA